MLSFDEVKEIVKNTHLKHIAAIMDGNRRWAEKKGLPSALGHKQGTEALRTIVKACKRAGVKYLTVYAFSTENWKRTQEEVAFLMKLFSETIKAEVPVFKENGIKLKFIGSKENLKPEILKIMEYAEKETEKCGALNLNIAFNYGSRLEITEAVKNICCRVQTGALKIEDIKEETVSDNLYTAGMPAPDLLIRTGGEKRISNYLLWQCAYSEIYVTDTLWPDFDEAALFSAIEEFNNRNRRFGK